MKGRRLCYGYRRYPTHASSPLSEPPPVPFGNEAYVEDTEDADAGIRILAKNVKMMVFLGDDEIID